MRKHLTRLAAVVLAAGLTYGVAGTGAWFTDSDESPANTITAARLDIDMRENGGRFGTTPQDIEYLAPGVSTDWAYSESVNIFNTISAPQGLDAKYRLSAPYVSGDPALYNQMWVEVRDQVFPGPTCAETGTLIYYGLLKDMSILNATGSGHGVLPAGNSHKFCLQFTLDQNAGNDVQGASAAFKFVANATQVEAPNP